MGAPTLWWYPPGTSSPRALTLGVRVTDLRIVDVRDRRTAGPLAGSPVHHDLGGYRELTLTLERRTVAATIRELRTLSAYLQAGGWVALCLDADKCYGGWCSTAPQAGDATVTVSTGNAFAGFSAGSLAAGDEITIESPAPECRREWALVDSVVGDVITVSGGVMQDYSTSPALVRYADLYPALYVPEEALDSAFPTADRRLNWTWDVTLREDPGVLEALSEGYDDLALGSYPQGGTGGTIADVLASAARVSRQRLGSRGPRETLTRW